MMVDDHVVDLYLIFINFLENIYSYMLDCCVRVSPKSRGGGGGIFCQMQRRRDTCEDKVSYYELQDCFIYIVAHPTHVLQLSMILLSVGLSTYLRHSISPQSSASASAATK